MHCRPGSAGAAFRQKPPPPVSVAIVDHRQPDKGDALAGVDMFAGPEPEVWHQVLATAVPRTYRKGQILFVENDPGESLIILKREAVAIFRTAPTGGRAVLAYPWQPPAGAMPTTGNWLYFQSTGEWVGQGQTKLLSVDDPVNSVSWSPGAVQIYFNDPGSWWHFTAAVPTWVTRWQTGWYPAAYGALANPVKAPLDLGGEGRGCNAVNGDLVVDTATHDADGNLTALSLRFKQICDGDPDPLYGAFRWSRG